MPKKHTQPRADAMRMADDIILKAAESTLSQARRVLADTADMVHPKLRWQPLARRAASDERAPPTDALPAAGPSPQRS